MIRVTQTFTCNHAPVPDPSQKVRKDAKGKPTEAIRYLPTQRPVILNTQGHSVVLEQRVCLCTGAPVPMTAQVEHTDPDAGKPH